MDFLSVSVSIIRSSWSFSSGWQDTLSWARCSSRSWSCRSPGMPATHASPPRASSDRVQEDTMSPSAWTRWSTWAWRTCRRCRRATRFTVPQVTRRRGDDVHLLLESVRDLQLHQQDALAHVQLLVQVLKVGMDVLFDGRPLVGQLLQEFSDQVQGLGDLGQSGRERDRVVMATAGVTCCV